MKSKDFVRKEAVPTKWCTGCGLHPIFHETCETLAELKLKKTVIISGIGCTGRSAGYFNLDTVHSIHGRAIPLAIGIKETNPKLNTLIISGEGDLLGIGLNHLIHAARRNHNITVICNNNEVYAMTGTQASPTTKEKNITSTTPHGNPFTPINAEKIITSFPKHFYARTNPLDKNHLKQSIKQAIQHKGFSFVEIMSPCIINYKKFKKQTNLKEIYQNLQKNCKKVIKCK